MTVASILGLQEWRAYRLALRDKLAELDAIKPTCAHCRHLDSGRCTKFGAAPPQEFFNLPEACPEWQYDGIPF